MEIEFIPHVEIIYGKIEIDKSIETKINSKSLTLHCNL